MLTSCELKELMSRQMSSTGDLSSLARRVPIAALRRGWSSRGHPGVPIGDVRGGLHGPQEALR